MKYAFSLALLLSLNSIHAMQQTQPESTKPIITLEELKQITQTQALNETRFGPNQANEITRSKYKELSSQVKAKIGEDKYKKLTEAWTLDDLQQILPIAAASPNITHYHSFTVEARVSAREVITIFKDNTQVTLTFPEFLVLMGGK